MSGRSILPRHRVSRKDFLRVFLPIAAIVAGATMGSTLYLSSLFITQSTRILQEQEEERLRAAMRLFSRINLGSIPPFLSAMEEPSVRDYLYGRQWSIEKTQRSLDRIDTTIAGNEFLDSIYLYNEKSGVLSTRSGWEDRDAPSDPEFFRFLSRVREYGLSRYVMRRVAFEGDKEPRNLFSIVFGTIPQPGASMSYAFVANLSERRIREVLAGDGLAGSAMYIVDAERRFLSHPNPELFDTPVGDDARFVPVLERSEPSGTMIVRDRRGERWIASWADHPEIRWRFITLAPEKSVFAPALRVRNLVVVVSALVMLAAILIAFALSLRMGERSRRSDAALAYLRGELEVAVPREGAAGNRSVLHIAGLFPSLKGPSVMAIVLVDGCREAASMHGVLSLYGLTPLLREALSERTGTAEVLRLSESSFVVLFGGESEDPRAMLVDVLAAVGLQAGLRLGAFIFPTPIVVDTFPDAYRMLRDALAYDFLRDAGDVEEATDRPAASMDYEIDFSRIEKAFRLDDSEDARRQVDAFIASLRAAQNADLFRYAVSALARRIPELLGADAETLLRGGAEGFRTALQHADRLANAESLLKNAAERLKERSGNHAERRQRDVVERVKSIVEERVADHALSTATIAAEVSLSASYLRDIFKRIEGTALLEYVGYRRLELAKQLLSGSDASVREVCDRAGFISYSYFFTYFKKATGRTPTEFRDETFRK